MTNEQLAFRFLDKLDESEDKNREASAKIRGWCITVWVASLAFVATPQDILVGSEKSIFPFLPIAMFWFLDGFQNSFRLLRGGTALEIEAALQNGTIDEIDSGGLFRHTSYSQYTYGRKVKSLFQALLLRETVVVFYLALAAATIAFIEL